MLVNSEVSEHALEEQEAVKVFVFPARSVVKYTDRGVDHLVITDE
jgi:hypothetical protein